MTSIFNTSWQYRKMHVWSKFGDSSPNLYIHMHMHMHIYTYAHMNSFIHARIWHSYGNKGTNHIGCIYIDKAWSLYDSVYRCHLPLTHNNIGRYFGILTHSTYCFRPYDIVTTYGRKTLNYKSAHWSLRIFDNYCGYRCQLIFFCCRKFQIQFEPQHGVISQLHSRMTVSSDYSCNFDERYIQ